MLVSYTKDKKILSTLAKENKTSAIQRALKLIDIAKPIKLDLKEVIFLVDTTYWGLNFGVVVFKDDISKSLYTSKELLELSKN